MGSYIYTGAGHKLDHDAARVYIRDGYLLGPRTVLHGRTKHPQFQLPDISIDLRNPASLVQQTLEAALGDAAGYRRAIMFSGGFDSMLMVSMAQQIGAKVAAVIVQFDDFNPRTVAEAIHFADILEIPHYLIHVKAVEFLSAFEELAEITDEPILDLDLGVVYAALKKYDIRSAGDVFISGMGCDQWFGNEALQMAPGGFEARLDWARVDQEAHQRLAEAHGCKIVFPFLSEAMLALSQSLPEAMKKDKKLLRSLELVNKVQHRGGRNEEQIPPLMRHIFIKTYGNRAWPGPVSVQRRGSLEEDQVLRQIILGLWWEKAKARIAKP